MNTTTEKLQHATTLLGEVIGETQQTQWNLGVIAIYLLHNGGEILIDRIPKVNDTYITLKQIMDLIDDKRIVVALEFDKLRLFKYGNKGLTPLQSFEELYELLKAI